MDLLDLGDEKYYSNSVTPRIPKDTELTAGLEITRVAGDAPVPEPETRPWSEGGACPFESALLS